MLTGDSQKIGRTTAIEVGLGDMVFSVEKHRKMVNGELVLDFQEGDHFDGLAEVMPEDKHRVVTYFQHQKHIVGMTG